MTRKSASLTFVAAAIAAAAASPAAAQLANSPWPVFQQNLQHTGQSPIDGPATGRVKWIYGQTRQLRGAPSVGADGTIFIGNGKAPFCAVSPTTGAQLWCSTNRKGGMAGQSQPAVAADGLIYGGARDNDLWAVRQAAVPNPPERVAWRFHVPFDGDVTAPPIVAPNGTIHFASNAIGAGMVYAWKPADAQHPGGTQLWSRRLGSGVHNSSPTLSKDGSTVYYSTTDSRVHALDAATGAERWTFRVFQGSNGFRQSNFTVVVGPNGRLYVGARNGLHALQPNATNTAASRVWHFQTDGRVESSPALASDGTLYVGSSRSKKGTLYAITPNGKQKWAKPVEGRFQSCQAAIGANGTVYVSVGKTVYALAPADGGVVWSFEVPVGPILTGPVIGAPGVLYVATVASGLYAFADP